MKKIKTVFSSFKEMHRLEKRLLPTSIVVAIVTAVMPFINIWFTSKIIDLLDIGTSMSDLAVYIGLIVSINFILLFLNNYLGDIQFMYRSLMYNKERQNIAVKLFKAEYQKLESSDFKELIHKHSEAQDRFFEHMQSAGYSGFSRGERGSTAENLTSLEHKIKQDQKRLSDLQEKIADVQVRYDDKKTASMTFMEIDNSGKKSLTGKYTVSAEDYQKLTSLAKRSYSAESEVRKLQDQNRYLSRQIWSLQSEVSRLKEALSELTEKCRPYLEALKAAPKAVKEFIDGILERFKKQEKSIMYEPIPAPKNQPQERGQRSKNRNYER